MFFRVKISLLQMIHSKFTKLFFFNKQSYQLIIINELLKDVEPEKNLNKIDEHRKMKI